MRTLLTILVVAIFSGNVSAVEVRVTLTEGSSQTPEYHATRFFSLNTESGRVSEASAAAPVEIANTLKYFVWGRNLESGPERCLRAPTKFFVSQPQVIPTSASCESASIHSRIRFAG